MSKGKVSGLGIAGAASILAVLASIVVTGAAEGQSQKGGTKTAAAKASATASAQKSAASPEVGRTPGSGSCNNDTNKCSGAGEVCRNNLCFCDKDWGRCHPYKPGNDDSKDCANLLESADDCGACGKKCPANSECNSGKCVPCQAGQVTCPAKSFDSNGYRNGVNTALRSCASLRDDEDNCGKCNHECPQDWSCVNAHCEP
jgi:hypothetical protein